MAGQVETTAGAEAIPAPIKPAPIDYRVELIANPRELPPERANPLSEHVADLACRACGSSDEEERDEEAIRQGWQAYTMAPGGRAQDYDRLVLVWDGDRLVQFSGFVVEQMEPDVTLLWYKAAGTDPEYQRKGAFAAARDTIGDPRWLTSFGPPTYFVLRTPNPLIYDTARKWWGQFEEWGPTFFPQISEDGELGPIEDETRDTAARMAEALWPECEFDADSFVVKDFLGKYGRDIWRVPAPESPQPGTQKFYETKLRGDNKDALMAFCLFYPKPD